MDSSTNSIDSCDMPCDNNSNNCENDSLSGISTEEGSSEVTYDSNNRDLQNESSKRLNYRPRSDSDGNEKFDLFSATESLRLYCNKLQSEKKKAKEIE